MNNPLIAKLNRAGRARFIFLTAVITILAAASLATGRVRPQDQKKSEEQDALRLNATLVQVPIIALDRGGKFVTDLSQQDFTVLEDGKRQEISVFATIKQPFSAVLILDTSNSTEDRLRAIQNAAISFARQMGPADRMMVISFDNEVRQLTDFTGDVKEIEAAIKGTESGFGKLLYEAVARGLEQLKEVEGRRAIVLFGDGIDMRSIDATAESTTRLAEELGAVIYSVRFNTRWWVEAEARRHKSENPQSNLPFSVDGRIPVPPDFGGPDPDGKSGAKRTGPRIEVGSPSRPPTTVIDGISGRRESSVKPPPPDEITVNLNNLYGEADAYLLALSSRTGGQIFDADNFSDTQAAFAMIANELRNQYLIGYYASNERRDGKYRKIKVQVARKEVQVRARPGYRPASD